ncbi:anion-transporting ATPase-domain-containing protein [Dunaliella salina]|uniref:Anion-transporting ATPase-domain-containing protein n=1 Tax=Dunaliella salina TaxID=3046 RepID=A0ABQ7FZ84_DUNSA|nr:anion-transporting ATPase-domain-containing protein [Dunaliella salina]|eukprot:KAF5827661.1 anion-transporting ATPase-domain-containing protein [Dunaliella salina]
MQHRIQLVKNLFRNKETTEFVIATIPTYMAVDESARLLQQLHKDNINCKRIVVNQVVGEKTGETYVRMKLKDQQQSLAFLREDPALSQLTKIEAPVIDLEVRGVPALSYFGNLVWSDVYDSMNAGADRKFFLMGGKGGVGKTSCAASLAVKFASDGYPTLIVSTDPAHSVSDSLDQGIGGGKPMPVISPLGDIPLYAMETDPEQARAELRQAMSDENSKKLNEVLDALGMGTVADQLKDLQLGDLLDTPPPGVDEAVAISKVVQLVKNPQYSHFKRIIFDTAPTGHTLRLLTLPEFLDNTIGKLVRLRQKLSLNAVKSFFTGKEEKDPAVEKLDELKGRMAEARDLFRNKNSTEFVIVTIPTMMAVSESSRLAAALKDDNIPVNKIVVNQVLQDNATEKLLATRRADQQRALSHMREDPGLKELQVIQGPLIDLEVRGVPALMYYGSQVWK